MTDTVHPLARASWLTPTRAIVAALVAAVLALAGAPAGHNLRAVRETQAIMSYYALPEPLGGRAGGGRENLCSAYRSPESVTSAARLPSRLALEEPLWLARWAFALCDRGLLEIAAAAPPGEPMSLPALFKAYAAWQVGDEDSFLETQAGNPLLTAMFREKALDASAAHNWPAAYDHARLAYRLGAKDARLLLVYADSALFSGQPAAEALPVLEQARSVDPTSFRPYQSLVNTYLHYMSPPDLDAAAANLELACEYGLELARCRLIRGEIAYARGNYERALAESVSAQSSADPSLHERAIVQEARSLAKLGRLSEATEAMGELVESSPDRADYVQEFLQFLLLAGEQDAALSVCLDFAQRCPTCLREASFGGLLTQLPECSP